MSRKHRCAFGGCWRTSAQPYTDGWANLCDWGLGIPDGFYCGPHADAIEALNDSGELDYIQSAAKGAAR
jgi:hypothetical protein